MATKSFKDLEVYQLSYEISVEIHKSSINFAREEKYGLTDQIRRSSRSICANIAEGYGRQMTSDKDFKRFLIISRGSCHEMAVWIDYCKDFEYIDEEQYNKWHDTYQRISKMLFFLIKSLNKEKS